MRGRRGQIQRAIGPGAALLLCGCNAIAGIHEGIFDPCVEPNTCGGSSGEDAGSSGGPPPSDAGPETCGNGVIDPGEECDDANDAPFDGCRHCVVECNGLGAFKDPTTHHCYRLNNLKSDFATATVFCASGGSTLAAITSAEELAAVTPHLAGEVWLGASELAMTGVYTWADGEPWGFAPWRPGEPDGAFLNQACIKLVIPPPMGFADEDCTKKLAFLCERTPPGMPPP